MTPEQKAAEAERRAVVAFVRAKVEAFTSHGGNHHVNAAAELKVLAEQIESSCHIKQENEG